MTRLRATLTYEYDADPADYEGERSPRKMARMDESSLEPVEFVTTAFLTELKVEPV